MSVTQAWHEYEQGVDYKTRIGLYRTVDLNERFYAGDQWAGIPHEGQTAYIPLFDTARFKKMSTGTVEVRLVDEDGDALDTQALLGIAIEAVQM